MNDKQTAILRMIDAALRGGLTEKHKMVKKLRAQLAAQG